MEKKYFNIPFLKVIRIQNDIIATSIEIGDDVDGPAEGTVQERRSIWDEY